MDQQKLIHTLSESFDKVISWTHNQTEENLNKFVFEGKWTAAQHVYHLVKSTKAVSKAMDMPKVALKTMFGTKKDPHISYTQLLHRYQEALANGDVATAKFSASKDRLFEKTEILQRFQDEKTDLLNVLKKWSMDELKKHVLPHPVLGKLSVLEMMYFTDFHTLHHLKALEEKYTLTK